jgi:2,3-diketo-5-methylthio-1-phosphopentane phosphatase
MVFFDFDNTMTPFDVLDDIIKRFSTNKDWKVFESAWHRGEISSRECLEGQLRSVRISKKNLLNYLSRITVDPDVKRLFNLLIKEGIRPVVLSDSFTFIIKTILENNGIKGAKVYANRLNFNRSRLMPTFPYAHKRCISCAHCKKKNLLRRGIRDKIIIYIGDGLSDICPAECSDIVFAKGNLLKHFRRTKRLCLAFETLGDIYKYFSGLEK